jgi:hypothetical protein
MRRCRDGVQLIGSMARFETFDVTHCHRPYADASAIRWLDMSALSLQLNPSRLLDEREQHERDESRRDKCSAALALRRED